MRGILLGILCASAAGAQSTWSGDIAPIFQGSCQLCHRPNDITPFPLLTYDDVAAHAAEVRRAVAGHVMPPWKPVPGYGEFRGSYALNDTQRQAILDWIDAGLPQGDAGTVAQAAARNGDWQLGDPDLVLTMAQDFTPPPGPDLYRCFVLPPAPDGDHFVSAVEVQPGVRRIVHHALLFIDTHGEAEKLDGQDGLPGYTCFGGPGISLGVTSGLGGWAPGLRVSPLPDGIAIPLAAGARVVMQIHYHPGDQPEADRTRIGIYYAKQPVERRLIYVPVLNTQFEIPPGEASYDVTARFPILPLFNARAITIAPHMHLLGHKIKVDLETNDGTRPLIYIDNWDFDWQNVYTFKEAVPLPALSNVRLTCTFDNSDANLRNPNRPPQAVRWGEGTRDEMCLAFLGVTLDNEALLWPLLPK